MASVKGVAEGPLVRGGLGLRDWKSLRKEGTLSKACRGWIPGSQGAKQHSIKGMLSFYTVDCRLLGTVHSASKITWTNQIHNDIMACKSDWSM